MISTFQIRLDEKTQLSEHIFHVRFTPVDFQLDFKPGQYVILHVPQENGHPARRLYSFASPASQKSYFDLIVEIVPNGIASQHLMKMQIGETITAQGPAGMFVPNAQPTDSVFLATGTGIAPIRSMIHYLIENHSQNKLYLFWGFPYKKSVYLYDEFAQLAKDNPNFIFMNCLSREEDMNAIITEVEKPHYAKGHVNDAMEAVEAISGNLNGHHYYVCGGPKMVESMKDYLLNQKQIPRENIHFEKFTV